MGMSAGTVLVTLHGYFMRGWKTVFLFHQVTGIESKRRQAGFRMANSKQGNPRPYEIGSLLH